MGRAPCCDKANVKKGPWSPEEDAKLKAYIEEHGTGGNWIALPQKVGLKRCGKSCRLRWLNYLRPNIKHGGFSEEEDNLICSLYITIGSRWSIIAGQLPGRTDNDIKNYWNTRLKKKLLGKQKKERQAAFRKQQEIKRESQSFMAPEAMNINHHHQHQLQHPPPYWPEAAALPLVMPVVNQIQDYSHHLLDQESLRGLLINYALDDASCTTQDNQIYASSNSISMMSSSASMNSLESASSQFPSANYVHGMFQGIESDFPAEFDHELVYGNSQQLQGLESLYGSGASSVESTSRGNMSPSLGYPTPPPHQVVSDYETRQQSMPQDSSLEDSSLGYSNDCYILDVAHMVRGV